MSDLRDLRPDVIAHAAANEGRPWHPVLILLKREDANRLAVGLNALLRAIAEAGAVSLRRAEGLDTADAAYALIWKLAGLGADTRRVLAEVAMALDVRLVAMPNQTGSREVKAQARSRQYAGLYDDLARDLNPASRPFGEEPGSIYASCGHKKYAEVAGRIRCGEMSCSNYVRKALAHWEDENGTAQPAPPPQA